MYVITTDYICFRISDILVGLHAICLESESRNHWLSEDGVDLQFSHQSALSSGFYTVVEDHCISEANQDSFPSSRNENL